MDFAASERLTFGLELELEVIEPVTGRLSASSVPIWEELQSGPNGDKFELEATQATIELNSSIHRDAESMRHEVIDLVTQLQGAAWEQGLAVCGGGTHVAQFWNERVLTPSERAYKLDDRFGFLPKRFSTYGMHVHVGMPDPESALRVANVFQAHTPLFCHSLGAMSPRARSAGSSLAATDSRRGCSMR